MNTTTTTPDTDTTRDRNDAYDYREAVIQDIREWIDDNGGGYDDTDRMDSYCLDEVTGNDNGSYTGSAALAEEYIRRSGFIFGDDWKDFLDWLSDTGVGIEKIFEDPESLDVVIRIFYFENGCWDEAIQERNHDEE